MKKPHRVNGLKGKAWIKGTWDGHRGYMIDAAMREKARLRKIAAHDALLRSHMAAAAQRRNAATSTSAVSST
jgi:hypothetical protein